MVVVARLVDLHKRKREKTEKREPRTRGLEYTGSDDKRTPACTWTWRLAWPPSRLWRPFLFCVEPVRATPPLHLSKRWVDFWSKGRQTTHWQRQEKLKKMFAPICGGCPFSVPKRSREHFFFCSENFSRAAAVSYSNDFVKNQEKVKPIF